MSSSTPTPTPSSTTVKLYFSFPSGKQEIRRFTAAAPPVLPALLSFLSATYERHFTPPLFTQPIRFSVAYDDGEDLCSVSSEAELQEGLQLHAAAGAGGVLKLLCRVDEASPVTATASSSSSGLQSPKLSGGSVVDDSATPLAASSSSPRVIEADAEEVTPVAAAAAAVVEAHESDDEYERIEEEEETSTPFVADVAAAPLITPAVVIAAVAVEVSPSTAAESPASVASPRVEEESDEAAALRSPSVSIEDVTAHPAAATPLSSAPSALVSPRKDAAAWLWGEPVAAAAPVAVEGVTAAATAATATASSSSSSSPSLAAAAAVHFGISCDVCGVSPIVGIRFHCLSCTVPGGYDLCARCEATEGHFPLSHQLIEFKTPEEAKAATSTPAAATTTAVVTPQQQQQPAKKAEASISSVSAPAASTSTASSSAAPALLVHRGVTCDGCRMSPLTGNRYHCTTCTVPGGFDLCEACEQSGDKHPSSHLMMKMRTAAPSGVAPVPEHLLQQVRMTRAAAGGRAARPRPWVTSPAAERPKAQFLSDVTCADGMQVRAGETLRKTWSIKNVGPAAWPTGVRLVFAGGDLAPESEGLSGAGAAAQSESGSASPAYGALVPFAGPGDVVHVSIDIVVPQEEGRFRGTFRLQTKEGDRFGPRIWIDLTVPPAAKEEEVVEKEPAAKKEVEAPAVVAAAAPAPAPVAAVPASAPVSASAASAPAAAPTPVPAAVVAVESKQREEEKIVASSSSAAGPVLGAGAWGRPVRTVPLNNSAAESALAAEFSSAHISPSPAAAAAAAAAAPISIKRAGAVEFQYSNQLAVLRSMGFVDKELCKYLLINNRGDLEKVVQWLLANAAK